MQDQTVQIKLDTFSKVFQRPMDNYCHLEAMELYNEIASSYVEINSNVITIHTDSSQDTLIAWGDITEVTATCNPAHELNFDPRYSDAIFIWFGLYTHLSDCELLDCLILDLTYQLNEVA